VLLLTSYCSRQRLLLYFLVCTCTVDADSAGRATQVRELQRVRQSIGYVPQHAISWPELSVRSHLAFFGRLRGASAAAQAACLADAGLEEQAELRASELSGGMQRRLQCAIALLGSPPIIFLDEPSAVRATTVPIACPPVCAREQLSTATCHAHSARQTDVLFSPHCR